MRFKTYFLPLILFIFQKNWSQKLHLEIESSKNDKIIIDSIGYKKTHEKLEDLKKEVADLNSKIIKLGFLEATSGEIFQKNDTVFNSSLLLKNKTNHTYIYIPQKIKEKYPFAFEQKIDTLKIKTSQIETKLNSILSQFEKQGYAFIKIKLINHLPKNNFLLTTISITDEQKRYINDIIVVDYPKFPKNYLHNLKRENRKLEFNTQNLTRLNENINRLRFVSQNKYPEVLFSNDSTKVFIYPVKNKINQFEGFLGFTNNEKQKIIFNGYFNINLYNIINKAEQLSIYWKSDGEKQKTFDGQIEFPYILKSPIGIKAQLNILKQDSIFQNTKTNIGAGYYFKINSKLFANYENVESSDIMNLNSNQLSDFKSKFYNLSYEFSKWDNTQRFPLEKYTLKVLTGFGKRKSTFEQNSQSQYKIEASYYFSFNNKNGIYTKTDNWLLISSKYLTNEQKRFGGINSIRGFNENSLQGNVFTSILTEYRYFPNEQLYLNTITDYAYLKDETTNSNNSLISIGLGLGLLTNNGILRLVYSNGSSKNQEFKLSNSLVQLNFNTRF